MRGQSLFDSLTDELNVATLAISRKGRSEELHAARNMALADRYAYYVVYTTHRLDVIYDRLSTEFYITLRRVQDIIPQHAAYIMAFRKAPLSKQQLKERYPHLVW